MQESHTPPSATLDHLASVALVTAGSPFQLTPVDWLSRCFSFVGLRTITRARQTCKHWNAVSRLQVSLASARKVWSKLERGTIERQNRPLIGVLDCSQLRHNVLGKLDLDAMSGYTQLHAITLSEQYFDARCLPACLRHLRVQRVDKSFFDSLREIAPRLESLEVMAHPRVMTSNIGPWIKEYNTLQRVRMSCWSKDAPTQVAVLATLPQLSEIHMALYHDATSEKSFTAVAEHLRSMPKLQKLVVQTFGWPSAQESDAAFGKAMGSTANEWINLRSLKFLSASDFDPISVCDASNLGNVFPNLTELDVRLVRYEELYEFLVAIPTPRSLRILRLHYAAGYFTLSSPSFGGILDCLPLLTSLTELLVHLPRVMPKNATNSAMLPGSPLQKSFSCGFVRGILSHLRSLERLDLIGDWNNEDLLALEDDSTPPHTNLHTLALRMEASPQRVRDMHYVLSSKLPHLRVLRWEISTRPMGKERSIFAKADSTGFQHLTHLRFLMTDVREADYEWIQQILMQSKELRTLEWAADALQVVLGVAKDLPSGLQLITSHVHGNYDQPKDDAFDAMINTIRQAGLIVWNRWSFAVWDDTAPPVSRPSHWFAKYSSDVWM